VPLQEKLFAMRHCETMFSNVDVLVLAPVMQASLRSSAVLATLPEYVLSFHPPLTIRNSIPYEITVTLSEGSTTSGSSSPDTFSVTVPAGGNVELQQYDLSQKIFMTMQLQVRTSTLNPSLSEHQLLEMTHRQSMALAKVAL